MKKETRIGLQRHFIICVVLSVGWVGFVESMCNAQETGCEYWQAKIDSVIKSINENSKSYLRKLGDEGMKQVAYS